MEKYGDYVDQRQRPAPGKGLSETSAHCLSVIICVVQKGLSQNVKGLIQMRLATIRYRPSFAPNQ